jgi:hypothetical protein
MHQQLWGYKVEEKLYVGVREQETLNTTGVHNFFLPLQCLKNQELRSGFLRPKIALTTDAWR